MALLLLLCAGCSEQPAAPTAGAAAETPTPTGEKPPGETKSLPVIDRQGLAEALAQRKGKLVLVDFWATWCEPCVKLFPHTVQLHRQWAGRGLDVIAVSLDDPTAPEDAVRFLAGQQAEFACFLSRAGSSPQAVTDLEIPEGGLPHLRLYDRQGQLYRSFNLGQFEASDIEHAVQELLNKGG